MAIKVQEIRKFNGFGTGDAPGEYYYSQGMNRSQFGIMPGWSILADATSATVSMLGLVNWFTQGKVLGTSYVYAVDDSGDIYRTPVGSITWSFIYDPATDSQGNGLIFDQKNRLLYAGQRYLGMYDGTADYTTGTVSVTNGSATVTGSGTTFTSAMVGKRFRITGENTFYTVATFVSATEITLSTSYTGTTGSGKNYTIYTAWTDQWKDFGASNETTDFRPHDTYEDWVLLGNKNKVAVLNVTDDSFNSAGFTFPDGYNVRVIKSGRTGALLGANINNRGVLALWDAQSPRSIAPWIWLNSNVKSAVPVEGGWIVITSSAIYFTNGYSLQTILDRFLDHSRTGNAITVALIPQGAELLGETLAFWGTNSDWNRNKVGIYLLHLPTRLFEFAPVHNGALFDISAGAIFYDNNYSIHVSYVTNNPFVKTIGRLFNSTPSTAQYILKCGDDNTNDKIAEAVKLNLGIKTPTTAVANLTFNVTVKLYNFRRMLWVRAQTNAASTVENKLKINGTIFRAQVGDEVTVLTGANAGQIRHITAIANQGTSTEEWTLDSNLPNLTEDTAELNVMPFQLVKKHTVTNVSELKELFFNVKNRIKGKKYLLKILFENMTVTPELHEVQFIYDDLGIL
jgi:hypothetical protein